MIESKILVVDDEADIRRFVRIALEKEGMSVFEAATAEQASIDAARRKPELVIVDFGLPDNGGKLLIRELRTWSRIPIVVLSARDQEAEKVEALDAGADDYLVKPFGVPELHARVRAQLRAVRFGDVAVDLATHETRRLGETVHLTPIEFRLLSALIRGHGKVITHRQLLNEVWGPGYSVRPYNISIYMTQLRKKLEAHPARPEHLLRELHVGYRLAGLEVD